MREILFRAKRKDTGEWVEGYLILIDGKAAICQCGLDWEESSGLVGGDWYFVDSTSIGQFTGLHDKNGKRIFEGDVIEKNGMKWTITHKEKYARFVPDRFNDGGWTASWDQAWASECEIIGTIHDKEV